MDNPQIRNEYQVTEVHEISVDWNGWNFLVIYGRHINGWFITIPNWRKCVEAAEPTNICHNTDKLADAFGNYKPGKAVAKAICEHWESINEGD